MADTPNGNWIKSSGRRDEGEVPSPDTPNGTRIKNSRRRDDAEVDAPNGIWTKTVAAAAVWMLNKMRL
ncbi:hypothetical protein OBBRIDRAFT_836302 [Obba rivulosa]|uniref:Uncharacterized protein n=1 Tax=Obba rivulosa TaxID=1052685 RepID=A0A8E2AUX9_9APHY|nr:hypothetical protein OBBRIDRAFT_836302 [Obba rivulosa]